jgi:hypothetical protein
MLDILCLFEPRLKTVSALHLQGESPAAEVFPAELIAERGVPQTSRHRRPSLFRRTRCN